MSQNNQRLPGCNIETLLLYPDGTTCRTQSPVRALENPDYSRHVCMEVYSRDSYQRRTAASALFVILRETRQQFWSGFSDRMSEIGSDYWDLVLWLGDATGLGDQEGDLEKAWGAFLNGAKSFAELAWKCLAATVFSVFYPDEEVTAYRKELKDLGLDLWSGLKKGYEDAYEKGGVAKFVGRLLADVLVLALEIWVAKGAASAARLTKHLPKVVQKAMKTKRLPGSLRSRITALSMRLADEQKLLEKFTVAHMKAGSSIELDNALKLIEGELKNFNGKPVLRVTDKDEIWIRCSDTFDGKAQDPGTGRFLTSDEQGAYLAVESSRENLAILSEWNRMSIVEQQRVPKGSILLEGTAAPQSGQVWKEFQQRLKGGGKQALHVGTKIDNGTINFRNPRHLEAWEKREIVGGKARLTDGLHPRELPDM